MKSLLLKNNLDPIVVHSAHFQVVDVLSGVRGTKTITLEDGSDLLYVCFVSGSQVDIDIKLVGKKSRLVCFCVAYSSDSLVSHAKVSISLAASESFADAHLLSIAMNDADIILDGGVSIEKDVSQVEGYLHEEQLILGKNVSLKSAPMLYVKSHDVKASHGAKIQKLDEQHLFYMRSKGLDIQQSQRLVIEGYLHAIFSQLDLLTEEEKDMLFHSLIDQYFTL